MSNTQNYGDIIAQVEQIFSRLQQEIPPGRLSFKYVVLVELRVALNVNRQIDDLIEGLSDINEEKLIALGEEGVFRISLFTFISNNLNRLDLSNLFDNLFSHHR